MPEQQKNLTCIVLDVLLDGSASSSGQNYSYEWQDENDEVIGTGIQISVDLPGIYTLFVTNIENGCVTQDEVTVAEDGCTSDSFY